MPDFVVKMRQWVEEISEITVEAASPAQADEIATSSDCPEAPDWYDGSAVKDLEIIEIVNQANGVRFVPPPVPRIWRVLDLSTWHAPSPEEYAAEITFRAAMSREEGDLLHVPSDVEDEPENAPAWLSEIYGYARRHDCDYVMFDRDTDTVDDLPVWEW